MTIFKPKRKSYFNRVISALSAGLLVSCFVWLYVGNLRVGVSHDVSGLVSEFRDLKVRNAELKNNLFDFFSPENVALKAASLNLTKDENPVFVYAAN